MALQAHLKWVTEEDDRFSLIYVGPKKGEYHYAVDVDSAHVKPTKAKERLAALLALPAALELATFIVGLDEDDAGAERWEEVAEAAREVLRVRDGGAP